MRIDELKPGQKKKFVPSNTKEGQTFTTFLNQCSESIIAMKEAKGFLYRGLNANADIFIGRPRENRKAKDTSAPLHREMDKLFSAAGFTALRSNSIFCSGDINTADTYGDLYIIFPINGFSFTWSPIVDDLYQYFQNKDITSADELYINQTEMTHLRNIAAVISKEIHIHQDALSAHYHKEKVEFPFALDSLLDNAREEFIEISEDTFLAPKHIVRRIKSGLEYIDSAEKKSGVPMNHIKLRIANLHKILDNDVNLNPKDIVKKLGYTDKDFSAAIHSNREIIVHGEYYAFSYDKYYRYLTDAILNKGMKPKL
jgi:hypothetical protein